MPLTLIRIRGSCRVRYVTEPLDLLKEAESVGFLRDQQTLIGTTVGHLHLLHRNKDNSRCIRPLLNNKQDHIAIAKAQKS